MKTRKYLEGVAVYAQLLAEEIATLTDDEIADMISEEEAYEVRNFVRDTLNYIREN